MRGEVRNESGQLLGIPRDDGNIISVCRPIIDEGSNG